MIDCNLVRHTASPSADVLDSQSVKALHAETRGYDAAKNIVGCKRHIAIDTDGRLLIVHLTPADIANTPQAQSILAAIRKRWPWVKYLFADSAHDRLKRMDKAAYFDFVLEMIHRNELQAGFQLLPLR